MNTRKEIEFRPTTNPEDFAKAVVDLANPEDVLTDTTLLDKQVLLPKISMPGYLADPKFEGLTFHFVITPIFSDVVDFRLTEDNKYEFLSMDGKTFDEMSEEFLADCADEMEQDFDERNEETTYHLPADEHYDGIDIQIGAPSWCQEKFQRQLDDAEIEALEARQENGEVFDYWSFDFDFGYETDYTDPGLQDENGDALEFVAQLNEGGAFGTYYLFYSPKTRLVRQFFLCT
ncbi:hypothetical protein [Flavobacterium sp.]|uniref:hypothetical protein n=1 Tax=Flavobacterium sp. TaxID=239 RepID=UPI001217958B|nr:hypothetical protein [Flavobacterium sp.]RZJ70736.1 MAG: hypothetical protein EOO49_12855 [Flavobacterium sp.]